LNFSRVIWFVLKDIKNQQCISNSVDIDICWVDIFVVINVSNEIVLLVTKETRGSIDEIGLVNADWMNILIGSNIKVLITSKLNVMRCSKLNILSCSKLNVMRCSKFVLNCSNLFVRCSKMFSSLLLITNGFSHFHLSFYHSSIEGLLFKCVISLSEIFRLLDARSLIVQSLLKFDIVIIL
jgi:hypothetical protein